MDKQAASYLPVFFLLLCSLISLTPVPFGGEGAVMPGFALIAAFYWGLLRPALMPFYAVALAGLILDSFASPVIGMYMLTLLLTRLLAQRVSPRFSRQTIWFFWAGFALCSLAGWLLYWLLADTMSEQPVPLWPALRQWVFTSMWYPLLHLVFSRCLAILPQQTR